MCGCEYLVSDLGPILHPTQHLLPEYVSELLAEVSVEGQSVEGLVHVPLGNGQVPGYRNQHGRLQGTMKTTTTALSDVLDH